MLNYRKMPSLQAYIIVDQNHPWIERHWRDESGEWRQGGLDESSIPIPYPETSLPLDEVYENL